MGHGDMKGMDHSQMKGMGGSKPEGSGDMQGMNHSQMKGMRSNKKKGSDKGKSSDKPRGPNATQGMNHGDMQGMDHGQMKDMSGGKPDGSGAMQGMDHSQMKGMSGGKPEGAGAMQGMDHSQMPGMDHGDMKGMDHSQMKGMSGGKPEGAGAMQGMDHSQMKGMDHGDMKGMDHSQMKGMGGNKSEGAGDMQGMDHGSMEGMGSMQGGSAPPDARDPDAYSNGLTLSLLPGMHMLDDAPYGQVLLDQFEGYRSSSGESGIRFDAQAWYGTDLNKVWLKAEGGRAGGQLGETRAEVLYNRAFAPYFGWQAGVRHDFGGGGPGRNWGAVGVQGLAPYWFDVEATAYVGPSGRTAFRFKGEYDLRITQRLVLQPDLEFDIYGKSDPERDIGSGLAEADLGFRLRYEITRKFAPYIGVSWGRKFGNTADFARRSGEPVGESRIIAGIRLWF